MKTQFSKQLLLWTALPALGLVQACATAKPPDELVNARSSYQRAVTGPANKLMPAELYTDKHALDAAEQSFNEDPESAKTRDLSYLALRKIETTESRARAQQYVAQRTGADAEANAKARADLKDTRAQLQDERQKIAVTDSQLQQTKEQLEQEKAARQAAEDRAREALTKVAPTKEDNRGTVLTLPGSVLFATGSSDLLPGATDRLSPVADALQKTPDSNIVVQGFTDSRGRQTTNQTLSQNRAESVRQFLVDHGVDSNRVKAEGRGANQPVASNTSAEGRANNRRVEIILKHMPKSDQAVGGSGADAKDTKDSKPANNTGDAQQ